MEPQLCPLFQRALESANQTALITETQSWSYTQLHAMITHLCKDLQSQGIKKNSRVAFIAYPQVSTLVLFWALFRIEAIACPLSTRIPKEQIGSHLNRLKNSHGIDPREIQLSTATTSEPAYINIDALATFLFTSGSSGTPKIACHTFSNHYYSALGALEDLQLNHSSYYLLSLPLFHVSGISIFFRTWLCGGTLVLSTLESIYKYPITHLSAVPTQLYRLLLKEKTPPPFLRCLLLGGAPASSQLLKMASNVQWPIYPSYGLTETSSLVTLGKVLPFRKIEIREAEIYVAGKTLCKGYWDTEKTSISDSSEEGWFATRDLGCFNCKGELEILGRKDRQFISGGENIQPEEIERALCTLPGVIAAHVDSIDDPEFGKRPIAYIEENAKFYTLETLQEELKPLLPSFKHPIELRPWPPAFLNLKT